MSSSAKSGQVGPNAMCRLDVKNRGRDTPEPLESDDHVHSGLDVLVGHCQVGGGRLSV
jgi:hypothetical protein